jgi:hypothetical protein
MEAAQAEAEAKSAARTAAAAQIDAQSAALAVAAATADAVAAEERVSQVRTQRALSVTQRALSVTQRALSVHPASSQRHPASSQRPPSELLASPSELLASPSELLASPFSRVAGGADQRFERAEAGAHCCGVSSVSTYVSSAVFLLPFPLPGVQLAGCKLRCSPRLRECITSASWLTPIARLGSTRRVNSGAGALQAEAAAKRVQAVTEAAQAEAAAKAAARMAAAAQVYGYSAA